MEKKAKNPVLQDDILRYKKNKFASGFTLLALVFNCLYFTLFYAICVPNLYQVTIGLSVIINLLVLLIGFYASEGIKGYNKKFSIVLLVLAAVQIIRIFYYPVVGATKGWLKYDNLYFGVPMTGAANATFMIIYLAGSAACFVLAAVQGYIVARRLEVFQKKLDNGELSVEQTLAELDAQEKAEKPAEATAPVTEVKEAVAEKPAEVAAAPVTEVKEEAAEEPVAVEDKAEVKPTSSEEADNG